MPKAFVELGGVPLFVRSLPRRCWPCRRSSRPWWSSQPDAVAQATRSCWQPMVRGDFSRRVVAGGAERQDSVRNGLAARRRRGAGRDPRRRAAVRQRPTSSRRRSPRRRNTGRRSSPCRPPTRSSRSHADGWIESTPPRATHLAGADAAGLPRRPDPRRPRAAAARRCGDRRRGAGRAARRARARGAGNPDNRKITTPDDLRWAEWLPDAIGSASLRLPERKPCRSTRDVERSRAP